MVKIRDLLARDLEQTIEEIIKVDQTDEHSVYTEITEYVATERIRNQYREVLRAMAEAPASPHEGVGVWISGFFGSGKSSFAKNLGYILANRAVLQETASSLFKKQVADQRLAELIDFLNARIPARVIMFDVSVDRAVIRSTERIAEIMYRMLLRELGYAEDYDIAELEIELEAEGKLDEFVQRCESMHGQSWRLVRKGAQKISKASAVLHAMNPAVYPAPDSWARSMAGKTADITVGKLVERTFELAARRCPGQAIVFIIDEVGQYVARSADKIEDLRAVVEEFGKESKNRLKKRQAVAPVWVIVTSQEKLDEVVAALDSKRVELAKLQDRFKYRIDLAPADIREVATRRVLAKREQAIPLLQETYHQNRGQLATACRLERTSRQTRVTEEEFIQFYPYLPHFIDLSIEIMSGIRLQPGAPKHYGGSNRTIIKQAYEMLVSERTKLAEQPLGTLVSLDRLYELVEGNLPSEKQKDISDIIQRFKGRPDDGGWAARVAKAVCLLEFIKDLPRTEANIAAVLVERVGQPAPLAEVQAALQRLIEAQFVRLTEEGYKLQTALEKNWETERRGYLEPKPKERNEIKREALRAIFSEPHLKTYRYRDLRSFRVGVTVDGVVVGEEGQIPLCLVVADEAGELPEKVEEARVQSRLQNTEHWKEVYWVFALTPEIHALIENLHASRSMIKKYDQMRSQNRITGQEAECLLNEKAEASRLFERLKDKLTEALQAGTGVFRGVSRDGSALGKGLGEALKKMLDLTVPDLYPKLEMGVRPLKGDEAETLLKAANLSALPAVFYGGEQGLNLVVKETAGKYVVNTRADAAKEVLDYLEREHAYGNKVTGKTLEEHFQGLGYGWERDTLRLVLAALLRAGALEVTYQGRRYRSHQDPQCRVPFENNLAFRSASFAPRESLDLKTMTTAVRYLEALTGQEVDVEEAAIAAAARRLADEEMEVVLPLAATAKAHGLPVVDLLEDYRDNLAVLKDASADDCVRLLAGEGKTLRETRDRVRRLREALGEAGLALIRRARTAVREMWPLLAARGSEESLDGTARELESLLAADGFFTEMPRLAALSDQLDAAYGAFYDETHTRRGTAFTAAVEEVKGRPEWVQLSPSVWETLLAPLASRACPAAERPTGAITCQRCGAGLGQMESDLAALPGLKAQALARLQELAAPRERVVRVRLADFFTPTLDSADAVDEAVERLRQHLHKLVAEGTRIVLE